MSLRESLSSYWERFQGELFPFLEETIGFLTESHKTLVTVLDMTRLEVFVPHWHGLPGRPLAERAALARASHGQFHVKGESRTANIVG
jgi:hypothetical protein